MAADHHRGEHELYTHGTTTEKLPGFSLQSHRPACLCDGLQGQKIITVTNTQLDGDK